MKKGFDFEFLLIIKPVRHHVVPSGSDCDMIFASAALQRRLSPLPNSPEMRLLAHGPALYGRVSAVNGSSARQESVVCGSSGEKWLRPLGGSFDLSAWIHRVAGRFLEKTRADIVLESSFGRSYQPLVPSFRLLPGCGQTNLSLA